MITSHLNFHGYFPSCFFYEKVNLPHFVYLHNDNVHTSYVFNCLVGYNINIKIASKANTLQEQLAELAIQSCVDNLPASSDRLHEYRKAQHLDPLLTNIVALAGQGKRK